jgi:uncharacterized protein YoxC
MVQLKIGIGKLFQYAVKHFYILLLLAALGLIVYQQFELRKIETAQADIATTVDGIQSAVGFANIYTAHKYVPLTGDDIKSTVEDIKSTVEDIQSTVDNIEANQR